MRPLVSTELRVSVSSDVDIVTARQEGRALAARLGFPATDLTLIATVISELARNILLYAKRGEVLIDAAERGDRRGIAIVARDEGPGIADVARAMQDGFSTSGGLGLGLPGIKRVMDEFEVTSEIGRGTTVTTRKWKSGP